MNLCDYGCLTNKLDMVIDNFWFFSKDKLFYRSATVSWEASPPLMDR